MVLLGEAAGQGNDENDQIAADEHHDTGQCCRRGFYGQVGGKRAAVAVSTTGESIDDLREPARAELPMAKRPAGSARTIPAPTKTRPG